MKRLLVVGATGDVGQGIVEAASAAGWQVVAAARNAPKLQRIAAAHKATAVVGDLASEASAAALWSEAEKRLGGIDAVVVSVNAPTEIRALMDFNAEDLAGVFDANVLTHFVAAKTFIPRLGPDGVYIGIGGGMADFTPPKMGHVSMGQAALRMMYRAMAREVRGGPAVRELLVVSMVNGESKRAVAEPSWLTDVEIGRHVCAVASDPAQFPGPILRLETRDQVGRPDVAAAKS